MAMALGQSEYWYGCVDPCMYDCRAIATGTASMAMAMPHFH